MPKQAAKEAPSLEFEEVPELTKTVSDMLKNPRYLPTLQAMVDYKVKILCVMKIALDENSEPKRAKGDPVVIKKIPPNERLFMRDRAHLLLTADYGAWNNANQEQREYMIFRMLSRLSFEMKEEDRLVIKSDKPDICENTATLEVFGPVTDSLLNTQKLLDVAPTVARKTIAMVRKSHAAQNDDEDGESAAQNS